MYDIITIGTATRDAFVKSRHFKVKKDEDYSVGQALCLPYGAKLDIDEMHFMTGGGATNMAVTFARQKLKTACVSKVGDDVSGLEVMADLKREGVENKFVIKKSEEKTAYSIILLVQKGERTVLVFRGASADISPEEIEWSDIKTNWFYLSGALSFDVIDEVIKKSRLIQARLAINPSAKHLAEESEELKKRLNSFDVVIMNKQEGAELTGLSYDDNRGIFRELDKLIGGVVVMTEGAKGVMVSDGKNIYQAGIFENQEVVDRTGAGDAFGSGFVAALAKKGAINPEVIKEAIVLGSANATTVVEKIGAKTGILTREDFDNDSRWSELKIIVEKIK